MPPPVRPATELTLMMTPPLPCFRNRRTPPRQALKTERTLISSCRSESESGVSTIEQRVIWSPALLIRISSWPSAADIEPPRMQRGVGAPFDSAAYSRDLYVGDLESPQRHIPQGAFRQSVLTARSERGAPPCASATD